MGSRGPARKPDVLKIHEGNRGHRSINLPAGVNPTVEEPDIPKHLGREARKEWRRIVPTLLELGLLTRIDRAALALYCQAFGRMVELDIAMARRIDKLVDEGRDYYEAVDSVHISYAASGYSQMSARASTIRSYREEVLRYLAQFGLSPSARARVTPSNNQLSLPGMDKPATAWQKFAS